ncbi:MAG: YeeE/YedE family protein [Rhodopseudomonas sp.]|uniref:YeeE/YedE thiosulfate transporter family protein n=1 Tax=Rhodopseudomonas sp. TaxID=1078 RepID=UPI0018500EA7|nr:YeeE/YedE thiosulfate transporter family protein [Rhodopseudomonas sp.]NVN85253.1 YeeE/YedE family protein [Rhodopseudomonas sp.]
MPSLSDKAWSPYVAGVLIGLLQIPAFLIIQTALGASSSFVTVGDAVASLLDPSLLQIDYAAKHVDATAKNLWQVALVVGVGIGAFISMKMSGARRQPISPIWSRALGSSSSALRYAVAFVAGFLMLFGARIADGCTSGHGLSGMAQLSVGSTVAVAAMFAGGIVTAMLLLRRI